MQRKPARPASTRFLDAWFSIRQFIQAANFNRFHGAGLSATQFMSLNLLPALGENLGIGELARQLNLKAATVAKTIDSLEARGLVARRRSEQDKRAVLVEITPAGAELQNAAEGQFRAQIEELFQGMRAAEREALLGGLESLAKAIGKGPGLPTDAADGAAPGSRRTGRSPRR